MPAPESQSAQDLQREDILTLPEAAAYLKVEEKDLAEMAEAGNVPARHIAGDWRFSRRAVEDWVRFPGFHPAEYFRRHPRWVFESAFMEEILALLEKRMLMHLSKRQAEEECPKPGSKQAVLKAFGLIQDDDDLAEQLEAIRKRREAGG